LPPGERLKPPALSQNYRNAQESFGIPLEQHKQSPLRPKRLRKGFRNACQLAGLSDDQTKVFMGHGGSMSKVYLEKTKEQLEIFYEMAEPYLTVYSQQPDESEELKEIREEIKKLKTERKNGLDVVNTLMYIANGPKQGYSKNEIDELWNDLIPKLRPVLKQINEKL